MSEHPITPPTKLIREWNEEAATAPMADQRYIAIQAARWGFRQCIKVDAAWLEDKLQKARDQELEACCEWLHRRCLISGAEELRAAMRPKPPSLAEQAFEALEQIDGWAVANMSHFSIHDDLVTGVEAIRRALERLQELEEGND